MSFIQNLFTSRDNNANGASYVGQEDRIWWNPDTNAFYYSDGNTSGGILITGGSTGNGLPGGFANSVQYNAGNSNFGGDSNFTFDASTSTLTITNIVANTLVGGAGGSNTQVQFNNNGNFTGNSNFTYNSSTNAMLMTGTASLGNVFPASNNTSNIGSSTNRFNDIWLGTGNINLTDDTLNTLQQIYAQSGNLVIAGGNGIQFGQFAIFGNTISTTNPTANINIGLVGSTGYVDIERPIAVNSTGGGLPVFRVEQEGTVSINSYGNIAANTAALLINGTTSGNDQPRNFEGTLIQATAQDNTPARMSADAFGVDGTGQNAYVSWAARVARGNVNAPSQTLANDIIFRFTGQGWSNSGAYIGSIVRYNQVALENFATGKAGTRHNFAATPVGTATIKNIANIDGNGITFSNVATGGIANVGITFPDGSYQNTAYLSTSVVRSLAAGAGISLSSATGNVTITNTGVLGIVGTTNQISITGNVGNVVTLGTPQDLAPTSNVQFNNLLVNNLTITGNVSNTIPATVSGPVIYVANTATTYADINNSGLSTGNVSNNYYASILYNTSSNTWATNIGNSTGITATDIYTANITANSTGHFGNASNDYDFPNALIQGDINIDGYGQFVLKNHAQTANSSADIVAVANNGDDNSYYIDMGINSNVYANVDYAITGFNDGYLYVNGGNLVIGTQTAGKVINFFTGGTDNLNKIRGTLSDTGLSMVGNVTANNMISINATIGGIVSAAGNITGGNLLAPSGIISASGNIIGLNVNAGIVSATGNIRGANINTDGLISTSGNIQAGNLLTTGLISSTGNINAANIAAGNITSAIISATGNITGPNITATILSIAATASITGNLQGGNFLTDGLISTTGNVTSNYFLGNGRFLTGLPVSTFIANGTSQVNIPVASGNANITIGATSNVAVFATTGAYITGLVSVTSNVVSNNVIATTIVNAASHTGTIVSVTGNINGSNVSATANISDVNGLIRSLPINPQSTAYTLTANDNGNLISITSGNVTVPASVFLTPFGQAVTVYNNSAVTRYITQGAGVTLRLAGTAATGNRTLTQYGLATIVCVSANTFVVSGVGLS